jgi:hypothetical protein
MPAAKSLQHSSQIMILDIGASGIQSGRCAGSDAVDGLGALASRLANVRGSRMQCAAGIISGVIQAPAGGIRQILRSFPDLGCFVGEARRGFREVCHAETKARTAPNAFDRKD